jgi:release factor glutamine methyltransferase
LSEVLGVGRITLYTNFDKPLSDEEKSVYREKLGRRASGEPVAYILNSKGFFGLDLEVNQSVLIPRPDTEVLVETIISDFTDLNMEKTIADLGTGSGCIAVALAHKYTNAQFEAWDISDESLDVAKRNADKYDLSSRINFLNQDILDVNNWENQTLKFDVIVSNPPYIAENEKDAMSQSVLDFEPEHALFAPEDGLLFYKKISELAPLRLVSGGSLYLEIGYMQANEVIGILEQSDWADIQVIKDYGGNDRVIKATYSK